MQGIPQTKSLEITNSMNDLLQEGHYVSTDNLLLYKLKKEVDALISVDAMNGYMSLASLYLLQGDHASAINALKNSIKLNSNQESYAHRSLLIFINVQLGYFAQAYEKFAEMCATAAGFESENQLLDQTILTGAYWDCYSFIEKTHQSNWNIISKQTEQKILNAKTLLDDTHTQHQDMIALLEIAGKVLRKHKLFFTQFSSSLTTDNQDAFPAITLSLGIQAPVEEIAEMNMALAELVSDELVSIPNGFHVYFSKTGGINDKG